MPCHVIIDVAFFFGRLFRARGRPCGGQLGGMPDDKKPEEKKEEKKGDGKSYFKDDKKKKDDDDDDLSEEDQALQVSRAAPRK